MNLETYKYLLKNRLKELGFDYGNQAGIFGLLNNDIELLEKMRVYLLNTELTEDSRNAIFEYAFSITKQKKQYIVIEQ